MLGFFVFSFANENLDGLLALLSSCFCLQKQILRFLFWQEAVFK
jgi:hypothetical protein